MVGDELGCQDTVAGCGLGRRLRRVSCSLVDWELRANDEYEGRGVGDGDLRSIGWRQRSKAVMYWT